MSKNPYHLLVDYEQLDPIKRDGLIKAMQTACFAPPGFKSMWGESSFVLPTPGTYSFWERLCALFGDGYVTGLVGEGLGTKNKRLEEWLNGRNIPKYWECIGMDNFAMNAIDLGFQGLVPKVAYLYLATGGNEWLKNSMWWQSIHDGWLKYCMLSRCVWGGGETPTLRKIIDEGTVDLAGSMWGSQKRKKLIPGISKVGDRIILLPAQGINSNGSSLADTVATKLENGYDTILPGTMQSFGDALFQPTPPYWLAVEALINAGVEIHAARPITGGGMRKLGRNDKGLRFVVKNIPQLLPIFSVMQEVSGMTTEQLYETLNCGMGGALIVPRSESTKTIAVCKYAGFDAWEGGYVEEAVTKEVTILSLGIAY